MKEASSPLCLDSLNAEQLTAVKLPVKNALILAGAGSGKTRVLTTRIAWLLQNGLTRPENVLAVTFTNKAAREMMTRLCTLINFDAQKMWMGTFHGICNRMLRKHHRLIGLTSTFKILDTQDQLSSIKRLLKQHNLDEEKLSAKQLQYFISKQKEEGLRAHQIKADTPFDKTKIEFYQLYENQCQQEDSVDFSELMLRSYELLLYHPEICQHYTQRFRHILIDEFQDTNRLQYDWIRLIAGIANPNSNTPPSSVLAVGDDDQSIYGFRGAKVGNMHDFLLDFHVDLPIKLEQNYRSHSNIINAANELISNNSNRLGKNLRTNQETGELIRLYGAENETYEARWVVDEIRHLQSNSGLSLGQIAILYRSNAQSRILETTLYAASISYRVYGGMRFFERAEIKHALAYLHLLNNVNDNASFLRVVNFPPRGIGTRSVEQLQDTAIEKQCSLYQATKHLKGRVGAVIGSFVALIDVMREQTQDQTLHEIINIMLQQSGLLNHYQNERDGQDRRENLEELINAAQEFIIREASFNHQPNLHHSLEESSASQDLTIGDLVFPSDTTRDLEPIVEIEEEGEGETTISPLLAFLTQAALESGDNMAKDHQEAVQLMTVHAAKGLEFDAVFIAGLEEGLFPHENSLYSSGGEEEERRLMYVAITRARKYLYLSHAKSRMIHGKTHWSDKSQFIYQLPPEVLLDLNQVKLGLNAPTGFSPALNKKDDQPYGSFVKEQSTESNFTLRQKVFHTKFGEGVVLNLQGKGADAKAEIHFSRHGTKLLALSIAKLVAVD